ncbi:hypothetical protein AKJ09_03895 [Labilithrix luteola]|uniref:Translocation and assembly module TamB C-terminal domain-containing protein n=1 Tax=Labilithrix luteola TaxID=1391654 RepID=A0A0K1PV47_9BACT|nr:translocation/assembly module TamB domain-containing protein [Labilithrix luteola]AKU97231.1 hypothetical protein AKJ09_03895 [Labilithrix luteola]
MILRRTGTALVRSVQALGLGMIFVTTAVGGVLVQVNTPPGRRAVQWIVAKATNDLFAGRLVVDGITELDLGPSTHLRVDRVEIDDPDGKRVLLGRGVDVRIDLARLIGSLARHHAPNVRIDSLTIDDVDVALDRDAAGNLGIARAFASKNPAPPAAKPEPEGVNLLLNVARAHVGHAKVHGNVVPPAVDGDVNGLDGHVGIADSVLTIDVAHADAIVRSPSVPAPEGGPPSAPLEAKLEGGLSLPLAAGKIAAHADLEGHAGAVPLRVHASIDGDKVEANVDIARTSPEDLARSLPIAAAVKQPVELSASVSGTLPQLVVTAKGKVGEGSLSATGAIDLSQNQAFRADVDLAHVDARAFGASESDVSAKIRAEGTIAGGNPSGTYTATTSASTFARERLPKLSIDGRFDPHTVTAKVRGTDRGISAVGQLSLDVGKKVVAFDVTAQSSDLRTVSLLPRNIAGSVSARATGKVDLTKSTVSGNVTAKGENLEVAEAAITQADVEAQISGPLTSPRMAVKARTRDIRLTAEGKEPLTYSFATAQAQVTVAPSPRLRDVEVHLGKHGLPGAVTLSAREVGVAKGSVAVRDARVTGLGAPLEVSAQTSGGELSIRAKGDHVDMDRAAKLTGLDQLRSLPPGTHATVDIELRTGRNRGDGHVDVSVKAENGYSAEVHAVLQGKHLAGRVRVDAGPMGFVEIPNAELDLPGGPTLPNLQHATGTADIRGRIDLSQGAALFAGEGVGQVAGFAWIEGRIERGNASSLPSVRLTTRTEGLDVTLDQKGKSRRFDGVDGAVHAAYDAATDETELTFLTWDRHGLVASANAKARIPLVGILSGTKVLDRAAIGQLEASAIVDVPRRNVRDLPSWFGSPDTHGALEARAQLEGLLSKPKVTTTARFDGIRETTLRRDAPSYQPVDGALDARWDGERVIATMRMDERNAPPPDAKASPQDPNQKPRAPGQVRGLVLARLHARDIIAGLGDKDLPWNLSAELDVKNLELAPLRLPEDIRGALTGRFKVRNLNEHASFDATASVDGLTVARVKVKSTELRARAEDGNVSANVTLKQQDGGSAEARIASTALSWKGVVMGWDATKSTRLDYDVRGMRLAILRPVVRSFAQEIDGKINGRGSASIDGASQVFDGGLTLEGGQMYVTALGEEISSLTATAHFDKQGSFMVRNAAGKMGTGSFTAYATGKLKGLSLDYADLFVEIPEKRAIPISVEGATYAEATGQVRVAAHTGDDGKSMVIDVMVPRAQVTLPDRPTQSLQSLDPDTTIDVGVRKANGELVTALLAPTRTRAQISSPSGTPKDKSTTTLNIALGNEVLVKGQSLRIYLGGKLAIVPGDETSIRGSLELKSGTADVQGRRFTVDHGTVTFPSGEPPDNPQIVAAAYWDAGDGTRVWVEFVGPVKTGTITLRSEPAYSKSEIFSLLLFGRVDPNSATASTRQSGQDQASTVGAGFASAGLNQAFSQVADGRVDTEQGTTGANRQLIKIGFRATRTIKVQYGYSPNPTTLREPDKQYFFGDWQFLPKWSLLLTEGFSGTTILDVLYQHRY